MDNIWIAVLTSSVVSTLLNQIVTAVRDDRKNNVDRRLSALYVAIGLGKYASECLKVLSEKDGYSDSDGHDGTDHGTIPALLDWPADIDWGKLGVEIAEKVFSLQREILMSKEDISDHYNYDPPDGGDLPLFRAGAFHGLEAMKLATIIRKRAKLTHYPDDFSPKGYLEQRLAKLNKVAHARFLPNSSSENT